MWVLANVSFEELAHFIQITKFMSRELLILLFWYPFTVCKIYSDVTSFISDISNLCPLSFFLRFSLARGLLILSILSKNQLLVSLILSINFLFAISLVSPLTLITSFLLLFLDLICYSFASFLRWKLRLFILDLSSILIYAFNVTNFPLIIAFGAYYKFGK